MRKLFLFAASAALLFACNKVAPVQGGEGNIAPEAARLRVNIAASGSSRATVADETNEAKVNKIEVLVFRDGALDGYGVKSDFSVNPDLVVDVDCSKGTRNIWAVINSDVTLNGITTENDLKALISQLKNNVGSSSLDNFVMLGSIANQSITGSSSINMYVDRIVARVWVKRITKNFSSAALQAATFSVGRIYLTNVVNRFNLGGTFVPDATSAYWYNRMGYDDTAAQVAEKDALILRTGPGTIASATDIAVSGAMYPYPNPTASTLVDGKYVGPEAGDWSIRPTRLVVEATVDGTLYYYPITLPVLEKNHSYEIPNLIITRPGSDNPDIPVDGVSAGFTIVVNDWEQVLFAGESFTI